MRVASPTELNYVSNFSFLGRRIFHYLKTRNIRGQTGQIAFDDNGDRMYAEYDVINVHDHQVKKIVGSFHYVAVSKNEQSKVYVSCT